MRASRPSRGVDRSPLLYSCGAPPPPACRRQGLHGGVRRETGVLLAALLRLLCAVGVTAIHRDACWPGAGMPIEGPIRSQRLGAAVRERRAGPAPAACCTNTPSATQMPQDSQDDQPPVRESGFAIFKRFFFSASGIIPVRTYLQSCMYFNKVPFQRQPKNWAESWVKQHGTISWVKQHGIIKEFKPYAARASPEQMAGFACVRESALI